MNADVLAVFEAILREHESHLEQHCKVGEAPTLFQGTLNCCKAAVVIARAAVDPQYPDFAKRLEAWAHERGLNIFDDEVGAKEKFHD